MNKMKIVQGCENFYYFDLVFMLSNESLLVNSTPYLVQSNQCDLKNIAKCL